MAYCRRAVAGRSMPPSQRFWQSFAAQWRTSYGALGAWWTYAESSYTGLDRANIRIESDRIQAVGDALEMPPDAQRLDATGCLILPGLINAHTHAHNNLFKGTGDNWDPRRSVKLRAGPRIAIAPRKTSISPKLLGLSRCSRTAVPRPMTCSWQCPPRPPQMSRLSCGPTPT